MTRQKLIIVGVVLLLIIALFTRVFGLLGHGDNTLTLYGNVDVRQVDLAFRVPGRIEAISVEEGEQVTAGQILAELDKRPLNDMLTTAEAQMSVAEAQLAKARAGSRPQEIAQAQAHLAEANAALASAREDHDRRAELVKSGAISQQVFDATLARYRAAQAQAKAAQEALSLARAGARTEDRKAIAAQAAAAKAQRDSAQTNLDDAVLTAPNAGTILTRAREPGAIVQSGETVLTLTIDRPMRIRAYVSGNNLSRVAPAMKVKVRADGNERDYEGTIAHISPTAEFTPKTVQTEDLRTDLVYRMRILITNPDNALRQGQPVTISLAGQRDDEKD